MKIIKVTTEKLSVTFDMLDPGECFIDEQYVTNSPDISFVKMKIQHKEGTYIAVFLEDGSEDYNIDDRAVVYYVTEIIMRAE